MRKPSEKQIAEVMRYIRSKGGPKGGIARAAALSPERRREIAIKAGKARGLQKTKEKEERLAREAQEGKS